MMVLYNVIEPCIVGGKHYTRPAAGVEADDAEAAQLVESGALELVVEIGDGKAEEAALVDDTADVPEPEGEQPEKPRRGGRTASSD